MGKISQQILSKLLTKLRKKTGLNQWKNVYSVIEWYKTLKNKKNLAFIVFDVVNYYPSITLELLLEALEWAKQFEEINDEEIDIIVESKNSLLYGNGCHWSKKGDGNFDVAQGSYDGAECCDIVGLFMLSELEKEKLAAELGKFRDDGLGASDARPRQVEKIKKKICEVYNKHGLQITVEANKKVVQFLDVELNLNEETFKPYIKQNDTPLYVNVSSNHPPSITRNIPEAVNRRLSALSSNEQMFHSVAPKYQEALKNAGYNYQLSYKPIKEAQPKKPRCRTRNIVWFNPPFGGNVKTNVGAKFLKLIDKHFPKNNPLCKIVNRNTVKVSYRCTPNVSKTISSHNSKVIKNLKNSNPRTCSCSKNAVCPLGGFCLTDNLIYQTTVIPTQAQAQAQTYIGLTSTTFKLRLGNHKKSFNHERYRNETTLSQHLWDLKEKNVDFTLSWKLIDRAKPFSPVSGLCALCNLESYYIIFKPELATINKRDEINNYCPHKLPVLLDKT